jgi:hypothetical protein
MVRGNTGSYRVLVPSFSGKRERCSRLEPSASPLSGWASLSGRFCTELACA